LVQIDPGVEIVTTSLRAVARRQRHLASRVRLFVDHLAAHQDKASC